MEAGELGGYETEKLSGCEVKSFCHPASLSYAAAGRCVVCGFLVKVRAASALIWAAAHFYVSCFNTNRFI